MEVLTTALTSEDSNIKLIQIEDRINKLENIISEISKSTSAILSDIKTVLSELENPMNYLKNLGIDEVILTMTENIMEKKLKEFLEKRLETLVKSIVENKLNEIVEPIVLKCLQEQAQIMIEEKIKEMKEKGILKIPIDVDELKRVLDNKLNEIVNPDLLKSMLKEVVEKTINEDYGIIKNNNEKQLNEIKPLSNTKSIIGITACASALIQMFGKSNAERIIEECYKTGWLSDDMKISLLRALSMINSNNSSEYKEPTIKDYVVAMFLFDKLVRGAPDIDFIMTLKLLKTGV
ncbi:MAG: hypothetical protein QXV07_05410 [Candidatus Methanomethylicaceae archaeon]